MCSHPALVSQFTRCGPCVSLFPTISRVAGPRLQILRGRDHGLVVGGRTRKQLVTHRLAVTGHQPAEQQLAC
jgi:hypothetical protein